MANIANKIITRVTKAKLSIDKVLYDFVEAQVLPLTPYQSELFWLKFSEIIEQLTPVNRALLDKRANLQAQIDQWHQQNPNFNAVQYKAFLQKIGYLVAEVEDFEITTSQVDKEIATMAGPQLVVPITNARFALNAVNARWGSLYDALYGSNIISEQGGAEKVGQYNTVRGKRIIQYCRKLLDHYLPLNKGSHKQALSYQIINGKLLVEQQNGSISELIDSAQCLGYTGRKEQPTSLLFKHHGLYLQLLFDATKPAANQDQASISDIQLEAALTTIMDCEDSVATVDAADKIQAYKNWLGLMTGSLSAEISKNGQNFTRQMNNNKHFTDLSGQEFSISGRSLMFIRNVGHLMTTPAILDQHGQPVFEGLLDAMVTSLIATININDANFNNDFNSNKWRNSQHDSIYIVKPKMHGPEEVAFANQVFNMVEQALNLPTNTIKMGIMDEERRTSVNLKACIKAASSRVVFINTGFLDRTGDEIHTSMHAGAMIRKSAMKTSTWLNAYENNNVNIGLQCGLSGKAQIGKGMWPIPDDMASMMTSKIAHVQAGANTAWVPSPTAATLHALHYHDIDVFTEQKNVAKQSACNSDDMLTIPLAQNTDWSRQEISEELDNNVQGILGYIVRWIDQGIGCSKVPDIHNIGLMEDRATLRISSQHIANWLLHKICTPEQVISSLEKMAKIVDQQNANDPGYQPISIQKEQSLAFQTACQLIFQGVQQPSGYTEPLLHQYREQKKSQTN